MCQALGQRSFRAIIKLNLNIGINKNILYFLIYTITNIPLTFNIIKYDYTIFINLDKKIFFWIQLSRVL